MGDQFTLNFMVINIMKMNTWISHFIFPLTNKFVNIYLKQINCKNKWILHQYSHWPKRPPTETTHGRKDPPNWAESTHPKIRPKRPRPKRPGRNDPRPKRPGFVYLYTASPSFASIIGRCTLFTPGCRMKAYK